MKISKLLKTAMIEKDVKSNRQLSQLSGVSESVIQTVLAGNNAKIETVVNLFAGMNLQISYVDKV